MAFCFRTSCSVTRPSLPLPAACILCASSASVAAPPCRLSERLVGDDPPVDRADNEAWYADFCCAACFASIRARRARSRSAALPAFDLTGLPASNVSTNFWGETTGSLAAAASARGPTGPPAALESITAVDLRGLGVVVEGTAGTAGESSGSAARGIDGTVGAESKTSSSTPGCKGSVSTES